MGISSKRSWPAGPQTSGCCKAAQCEETEKQCTVSDPFHKFPHTPHLLWLGEGAPRDDKIMSRREAQEFLEQPVVIEEKVDGGNLGLSVGADGRIRAQSRGNFLAPGRCHAQWNPLWPWLAQREHALVSALGSERTLFGEWCHARHTIAYDALPDWFIAFDVFEPGKGLFWPTDRRNVLAAELSLSTVPEVARGRLALRDVPALLGKSALGAARMEGVYLRREAHGRLLGRAKVVGAEFKQQIEAHWTRRPLIPNHLLAGTEARS